MCRERVYRAAAPEMFEASLPFPFQTFPYPAKCQRWRYGTDLYNCEVTPTGRGTAHIFEFEGFEECDQRDLAGVS